MGYQPLLGFLRSVNGTAEDGARLPGLILADEFRDGNVPAEAKAVALTYHAGFSHPVIACGVHPIVQTSKGIGVLPVLDGRAVVMLSWTKLPLKLLMRQNKLFTATMA